MADGREQFGLRPTGGGVYGTSGRIEKGYRLQGAELESEYNPLEAGLARPRSSRPTSSARRPTSRPAEAGEPEVLHVHAHRRGRTPIRQGRTRWPRAATSRSCTLDGDAIVDSHGRVSRVTTAGYGPSVGKHLLMAYLPPEHAAPGTELQVMYMNETVPRAGRRHRQRPFDPDDTRLKC